ncbi:MAG: LTA synthase family protein [bacterium]
MLKKFIEKIKLPSYIQFSVLTYLWGLLFFLLFRFGIFVSNTKDMPLLPVFDNIVLLAKSFFMGLRFDTVISGYILAVPFLIFFIFNLLKIKNKYLNRIPFFIIGILYTLAFLICSANIPFFNHYFDNITTAAFIWADNTGFVVNMILQEWTYWIFIIVFVFLCVGFWYIFNKIFKISFKSLKFNKKAGYRFYLINVGYFLFFAILIFLGIRGRVDEKSPIRTGTAYFSQYPFPNKLGLNPVFTLLNSYILDRKKQNGFLDKVDPKSALKEVIQYLGITNSGIYGSPIARQIVPNGLPNKMNVIVVIMESMSAEHLKRNGETKNLTPFLDKLIDSSYYFENFYTAGIHTYCGTFATLYGLPTLFKNHPMNLPSIPYIGGFAASLRSLGYKSLYFTTHDDQFDNAGGFMYGNQFDSVIAKADYPSDKILSTLGVPDHYMFEFGLPILDKAYKTNGNFFASFLTSSNHGPYKIPMGIPFKAKTELITDQIVEYSDWAIEHFILLAKKKEWFKNTLFVFVADHGTNKNPFYDLPLCFTHSPLILYAPYYFKQPKVFTTLGGQIDIFSTVMGVLNVPYINNSLGIDLINNRRKYIYFCSDEKIGCLSSNYYLIMSSDVEYLYKYKTCDIKNYINDNKTIADTMRNYASNMLITTDYLIKSNLIKLKK